MRGFSQNFIVQVVFGTHCGIQMFGGTTFHGRQWQLMLTLFNSLYLKPITETTISSGVQAQLVLKLTKYWRFSTVQGLVKCGWLVTNVKYDAINSVWCYWWCSVLPILAHQLGGCMAKMAVLAASVTVFWGFSFQAREAIVQHCRSFCCLLFLGHPVVLAVFQPVF